MPAKKIAIIIVISFNTLAFAQQDKITTMLQEEEKFAEMACQYIKQDTDWKNLLSTYSEIEKISQQFPKNTISYGHFASAGNSIRDIARGSRKFYDQAIDDLLKGKKESTAKFQRALRKFLPYRVLQNCGIELLNAGLIYPDPVFDTKPGGEDKLTKFNTVLKKAACLKDVDKQLIDNFHAAEKGGNVNNVLDDLMGKCYEQADFLNNDLIFPFHDMLSEKGKEYYTKFNTMQYERLGAEDLASAKRKLPEVATQLAATAKNQSEKNARISKIKGGNLAVASSCSEIAEALISKDSIGSIMFGYPISNDAQSIYLKPDLRMFATLGRIISSNKNEIVTYDRNQISGAAYSYKIKPDKNTVWFKDDITIGKNVYFVGKYIDNGTVRITQGQTQIDVSARIIKPVCVTSP